MSNIKLTAQVRENMGKGASRRLRRLEEKVPAIIYGGEKAPVNIVFTQHELLKPLANEAIYSSVIQIEVAGKNEQVILKAIQRHPYKTHIVHLDFQRVSAKDVLVKQVPLHFTNEEKAKGVKAGGILSHNLTQVEVRCEARSLPEYIEVDVANLELNQSLHLTDLKLPASVELTADTAASDQNLSVVSIHAPKVSQAAEEEVKEEAPTTEGEEKASNTAEE